METEGNVLAHNLTCDHNEALSNSTDQVAAGGGLFNLGTTVLYGGRIYDNSAPLGNPPGGNIFNGNDLTYVLPAPPGFYIDGAFVCGHRPRCPDEKNPGQSKACDQNPCDADLLFNRTVARIEQGPIEVNVPYACQPGFFANSTDPSHQSTALCSGICPAGSFCPDTPSIDPLNVSIGFWSTAGATAPSACIKGTFGKQNVSRRDSQEHACDFCPIRTTTHSTNSTSQGECICISGFYRDLRSSETSCKTIPSYFDKSSTQEGLDTKSINVSSGHWRPSANSTIAKVCPIRDTCAGGPSRAIFSIDDAVGCADGFKGPYCTACLDDSQYLVKSANQMATCKDCHTVFDTVAGAVVALLLVLWLTPLRWSRLHRFACGQDSSLAEEQGCTRTLWRGLKQALYEFWDSLISLAQWCRRRARVAEFRKVSDKYKLFTKLKICLSAAIIIAQFPSVYQVCYPPSYAPVQDRLLAPLAGDFLAWVPGVRLECLGLARLVDKLKAYVIAPIFLIVPGLGLSWYEGNTRALPNVLRFTYLIWPIVSSKGFQALTQECDCFHSIDDASSPQYPVCLLPSDRYVECPQGWLLFVLGWLAVGLYGFGVPLVYLFLLWTCRKAILGDGACQEACRSISPELRRRWADTYAGSNMGQLSHALRFLHVELRPEVLWWPLVEALRALVLTGFLALLHPGSITQLLCGTLAACTFAVLQMCFRPYRTEGNNAVATVASSSLVLAFLCSLGVQINSITDSSGDHNTFMFVNTALLEAGLFVATFAAFAVTLFAFKWERYLAAEHECGAHETARTEFVTDGVTGDHDRTFCDVSRISQTPLSESFSGHYADLAGDAPTPPSVNSTNAS